MSNVDITAKFPEMTPIRSTPLLFRINGCGLGLYGRRDRDEETGAYVATLCLSLLFIPLVCLRSYRVLKVPEGFCFLGREPMSYFAKCWNIALVVLLAGGISIAQIVAYTDTPEYKARQQMRVAAGAAKDGHPGAAAKIYEGLILGETPQAAPAAEQLKALLGKPCEESTLKEAGQVVASAIQVAQQQQGPTLAPLKEIVERGLQLVEQRSGDVELADAAALLDLIQPHFANPQPVLDRRLELLRRWAAKEPGNLAVVVPLASLYEQRKQHEEAKKTLLPVKDKLGDGEGAMVLGMILRSEGDSDGAYRQLWPYVQPRLQRLHDAEKNADQQAQHLWEKELKLLENGKAPESFYARYKQAGSDEKKEMVQKYLYERIRSDVTYRRTQESLEQAAKVVPVALELGMLMLERAQGQANPADRRQQLEDAEKVFLAIGGVAGEADAYRVSLGQVYYWLGKQREGRELFQQYLESKHRAVADLLQVGECLRRIGAQSEARALAEEAYKKGTTSEELYAAAVARHQCATDLDDSIQWLRKADSRNYAVMAELAKAVGQQAFRDGRDAEALSSYRSALETYGRLPRSTTTLNQMALIHSAMYQCTGDPEALARSADCFQQAVALSPGDSILIYNAGYSMLQAAMADLLGSEIDLKALRQNAGMDAMYFLYADEAGRTLWMERVKSHPGVARSLAMLERAMVLSAKSPLTYEEVFVVYRFTRNDAALQSLEQRLRTADLDTSDQETQLRQLLSGSQDQKNQAAIAAALKRGEERLTALRAIGGRTASVALTRQVGRILSARNWGQSADLNQAVAYAREAHQLTPSYMTDHTLRAAYLARAMAELETTQPALAKRLKVCRQTMAMEYIVAALLHGRSPLRERLLQHPDVQATLALQRAEIKAFPTIHSISTWAMLEGASMPEAAAVAENIRRTPRVAVSQAISNALSPCSGGEALDTCWLMEIQGQPEKGQQVLRAAAARGVPLVLEP